MVYENSDDGEVFLSEISMYDAVPPFQHPVKIRKEIVAKMMKQMTCEDSPVFSEIETERFAEGIYSALRKARKKSFVSFYISEKMLRSISGGEIYVKDNKIIWFFYPASEVYQRSPVVSDRLTCLTNKKFAFTLAGEPTEP